MSVLYFADDLAAPSVLWMRRMLELLEDDVAALATEVDPGPAYRERYDVTVLRESFWAVGWRLCRRLGLVPSHRKTGKAIRMLSAAVGSERVRCVLAHYLTLAVKYDRVWRRTDKPVFVHCHGYDVTWDLTWYDDPSRPAHDADYVERVRGLPENVRFVANSLETKRRLLEIDLPEERIRVKYIGAPISASPPEPRPRGEKLTVLYLGRLIDCKGPEVVIRAFDLATRRGLDGRLLIAGAGPQEKACVEAREAARFPERIELLGAVDARQAADLRRRADVFTAHNRRGPVTGQHEAFGVSFVEAMGEGLPVVSGRDGSLPEIVDDGVHGILVEPGDVDAHAEALLRLADDPGLRARMGAAGWRRARERFSLEGEGRALRELLGLETDHRPVLT